MDPEERVEKPAALGAWGMRLRRALSADKHRRGEVLQGFASSLEAVRARLVRTDPGAAQDLERAMGGGLAFLGCHFFEDSGYVIPFKYELCTHLGQCVCPEGGRTVSPT